ncbi:MAG: TatD family hydrolase, partial [Candidatus Thermoplasmatota archaeon]|nr:TatD family hydrolase [Candidatus Thermoplasmatota archaeon]
PVDYLKFIETHNREFAVHLMRQGIDEAADLCTKGVAIGIGEIGRPHFPIDSQIMSDSNQILLYGMQKAQEIKVPVIIHSESTTPDQCLELVRMGAKVGLPADKIVKHFSPPLITYEENHGLLPSVLASKKNVQAALKKGDRFLMETDYIDDPRRPGAVLGTKTVPRLTHALRDAGCMTDKQYQNIHITLPQKTYDIDLDDY